MHPWTEIVDWTQSGSTIILQGEEAYVLNAEGEQFIDGVGGLWFANVGFGRRDLIDAAYRQLELLPQYSYFTDTGDAPATELSQKLGALAPGDLDRVFYSTGGSEADDTAARLAHFYFIAVGKPSKHLLIARRDADDGSTYLVSALSGKALDKTGFHLPSDLVHFVSEANCYRMPREIDFEEAYCDYLVDEFEQEIAELGADRVACFFAEPIMGASEVLVAPSGYHRRVKQDYKLNDILYVSDEVVTSFSRLGHFFSSTDRFDVVPGMIVTAKGITSGYMPLGATLVSERLFDAMPRRSAGALLTHEFTYSDHAACCAVALANIDVTERDDICGHLRGTGPIFKYRFSTLGILPIVRDLRGSHFMRCVEIVRNHATTDRFRDQLQAGRTIARNAQSRGPIVRPIRNVSMLSPALILSRRQIHTVIAILGEAIEQTMTELRHCSPYA